MQMRIEALHKVTEASMPGFCEYMKCDSTCPMFKAGVISDCAWLQLRNDIARMNSLLKYKDGIVVD